MDIPQLVEIIKKWGLSSNMEIKKMLKTEWRNVISVDIVKNNPIREYGGKKRDKTSKYKILNNDAYYVHHDWDKNQKVRENLAVP